MKILSKEFWDNVLVKLVETSISVKVWTIIAILSISTVLLTNGVLTPVVWGNVNAGVISTVFALREGFKVSRLNKDK